MELHPGAQAWFVEGLDMWMEDSSKMAVVAQSLDDLQRLATRRNVAVIASVGSAKQKTAKGKVTEQYHGRDTLFGSVAWGRKTETIVLISKTDEDDDNSPRQYSVLPRNGSSERFWMDFKDGELRMVPRPEPRIELGQPSKPSAIDTMESSCLGKFKPGDEVLYSKELGPNATFYRWRDRAVVEGIITESRGKYFRTHRAMPQG
jgi:hypothetical protein